MLLLCLSATGTDGQKDGARTATTAGRVDDNAEKDADTNTNKA